MIMATANPFAILDDLENVYANAGEFAAAMQAQEQADINKKDYDKIKRLQQVGKDLLGRAPGQDFYNHFGGQYETLISQGMNPDDAIGVISKDVSMSSESQAFKEEERVAAQYEGAPDWFTRDKEGGAALGHHGHESDFQLSLDPDFLTGYSSQLNDKYGYYQGNTVGTEGIEYWSEQYQDNVTHLVENEGLSFAEASAQANALIDENIQQNPLHIMYGITGNVGPGQKAYIDDGSGGQTAVRFNNTSTTLGFNPNDPNQPFYNPDVAALGGYQDYLWDVNKNPDVAGGLQATGLNEAAKHHENTFQIQTSEGAFNPFNKPIEEAAAGLDIKNINAGSETLGLFVDRKKNEEYKAQLEAGDFTGNVQGLTGTFKEGPDGTPLIDPHTNIISVYDQDGNHLGNNPLLYNQNPGSTVQTTKAVSPFAIGDPRKFSEDPLIVDPYGTLGPTGEDGLPTGLLYGDDNAFTKSKAFQTKVNEFEDRQGGNYVYGGGGGGTTIINQTPQKNKTAEMQQIKQDVRGTGSGKQRKYHKFRSPKPASIPGATGGLDIPTG